MPRHNTAEKLPDVEPEERPRKPRGAPEQDADLTWLYCQATGEIGGLVSMHNALVTNAQTGAARAAPGTRGVPRSIEGISARRAAAVDRERPLRAREAQLSPEHRETLRLVYGDRPPWISTLAADARKRLEGGIRQAWLPLILRTKAAATGWEAERVRREVARRNLPVAKRAQKALEDVAFMGHGMLYWLAGPVHHEVLAAIGAEAQRAIDEACAAWKATKAPKQKEPPTWGKAAHEERRDGDRESGVESIEAYRAGAPPGVARRVAMAGAIAITR